jgi:signal peptidase II
MTVYYVIIALAFILDQISKIIVRNNLNINEDIEVIRNFFYITHVENTGAAWSIFQGARWFFVAITVIMTIVLIRYLYKIKNKCFRTAAALIIGGGLGNLLDRVITGRVTDFISLDFWGYGFPVFNISDSFVFIGTIVLGIYVVVFEGTKRK